MKNESNGFLITEIKIPPKETKIKDLQNSHFLVKNNRGMNHVTDNFLEFMITQEPQYADLFEIEKFYSQKAIKYRAHYNEKQKMIENKKKELNNLQMKVESMLVTQVDIAPRESNDMEFEALRKEIEKQNHSLQVYHSTYKTLYDENILLKKELNDNIGHIEHNRKLYDKFSVLNRNAKKEYEQHKRLFTDMNNFQYEAEKCFQEDLNVKKGKYIKLEYNINNVKAIVSEREEEIKRLAEKQMAVEKQIAEYTIRNSKNASDISTCKSDYLKTNQKLFEIFHSLHVKDVATVISKFKDGIIQYNSSCSIYNNVLNDISLLSKERSAFLTILKKINTQIANSYINMNNQTNNASDNSDKILIERQALMDSNLSVAEIIEYQENLLKNAFRFIFKYDKKMTPIVNSISHATSRASISFEDTVLSNDDCPSKKFENILKGNQYKELLSFFMKFQRKILFIFLNYIISIAVNFYNNKISTPLPKFFICGIQSEDVSKAAENDKTQSLKIYQDKLTLKNKTFSDIIGDKLKLGEMQRDINLSKKVTLSEILDHYYDHIAGKRIDEINSIKELLQNLKKKFFFQLSKFTNDSVLDKENKGKVSFASFNMSLAKLNTAQKTEKPRENFKQKSSVQYTSPNFANQRSEQYLSDSFPSEDEIKKEVHIKTEINKKKNYESYRTASQNSAIFFKRINDLHKLELNYFKRNSNQNFNEIYYEFQKRLNQKAFREVTNRFLSNKTSLKKTSPEKGHNKSKNPSITLTNFRSIWGVTTTNQNDQNFLTTVSNTRPILSQHKKTKSSQAFSIAKSEVEKRTVKTSYKPKSNIRLQKDIFEEKHLQEGSVWINMKQKESLEPSKRFKSLTNSYANIKIFQN